MSLLKWNVEDSKSDSNLALKHWKNCIQIKVLQAIKLNSSLAAAEKRGALKVADVLEKATYRATFAQLVYFDQNIKQMCSIGRKNDAVITTLPKHVRLYVLAS